MRTRTWWPGAGLPVWFCMLAILAACADKILLPERVRSPRIMLQFAAGVAEGGRAIDVHVGYDREDGSRVAMADERFDVTGATQTISLPLDLTTCIEDRTHAGAADGCRLRIAIALHDSVDIAIDSVDIGPFNAVRGVAPGIPEVSLGIQRFAVHRWEGDEALRLGGDMSPNSIRTISGYIGANGVAVPVVVNTTRSSTDGLIRGNLVANENGQWRRLASFVTGATVTDVAAVTTTEMWISASSGLYRYDGTTVTAVTGITDSLITVAARVDATGRLVVAAGRNGSLWTGDGTTWRRHDVGGNQTIQDGCVASPTEAFVGTAQGNVYRFDGTAWTQTPTPSPAPKFGLYCTAPSIAFAYDTLGLYRWNGGAWIGQSHPFPNQGVRIQWGAGAGTDVYAEGPFDGPAGNLETAFSRLVGGVWQELGRVPWSNSYSSSPVWADPRGGAAFVAASGWGRVQQIQGNNISLLSHNPAIRDISVSSATNAVAVGWNLFLARWNGTRWTIDRPPAGVRRSALIQGAWTDGPSNAWAVAGNGGAGVTPNGSSAVLHWNGSVWNVVPNVTSPTAIELNAVWGQGNVVHIVGSQTLRCTGESCVPEPVSGAPLTGSANSIWGSSLQNIFLVGDGGIIAHNDGTGWTFVSSPTQRNLRRVWGSGPTDVWAVGDSVLIRYDGTTWRNVPMTGDLALVQTGPSTTQALKHLGLWGTGPNDVYVGGDRGLIARFDGSTWQLMPTPSTRRIIAISGTPTTGAIAIGDSAIEFGGPVMLRGISANGAMSQAMGAPTIWY